MARDQILYFVKYPEPGKVKTRLAKSLGDEVAAKMYRELAETNLKVLSSLQPQVSIVITFDPPEADKKMRAWLGGEHAYRPQFGNGLTERLTHAFREAFAEGAGCVVAIGSDTLGLSIECARQAFDSLKKYDVALGPAKDGGYYLIGLSGPQPLLFEDIPWSTKEVLEATVKCIKTQGLTYYLTQELEDLDQIENLGRTLVALTPSFTNSRKSLS